MVQLSNVSSISMANLTLQPFPKLSILLILVALIGITINPLIGVGLLAIGILWIMVWQADNEERRNTKNLNLMLNSGTNLCIQIKDLKFLERVLGVLEQILINGGVVEQNNISINIQNSTFEGNAQVLNDLSINR